MKLKALFAIVAVLGVIGVGGYWLLNRYGLTGEQLLWPGERRVIKQTDTGVDDIETQEESPSEVAWDLEEFATGLEIPWELVFTSSDRMLVTERPGRIRAIIDGQLLPKSLIELADVATGSEEGLMGMALSPDYESNRQVYVCYAYESSGGIADRVMSLTDEGNELVPGEVVIEGIPAAQFHAGCRIKFGPDGKLYVTTGDATDGEIAQDLESLGGKILRLNEDGSVPDDNPYPNSYVYSYGHRNPQGIDWNPENRALYSTEHGPSGFDGPGGGDEVNLIRAGQNYGWPLVHHEESREGMVDPLITFTPAVAPGSAMIYSGDVFPQFKGDLFFGGLRGEGVYRVEINDQSAADVVAYERLLFDVGRIRPVITGPDGLIYFATSNRDGRGQVRTGDDKIYRLVPRE